MDRTLSKFSGSGLSDPFNPSSIVRWTAQDHIDAHNAVVRSGSHNFLGCKIPIPTPIRHDRIKEALGNDISPDELRVMELLQYGMPLDCKPSFGIRKKQKNHHIGYFSLMSKFRKFT